MRDFSDLGFTHGSKRRQRAAELLLAQAEEKIGLVFARIDAFAQNRAIAVMLDNGVMARRDEIAAKRFGFAPEITELEFLVAHDAGIRRPTRLIFTREIIDHRALKLVGFIDHVMGNA